MNTANQTTAFRQILLGCSIIAALGIIMAGHGTAGPVVQSTQSTVDDTTSSPTYIHYPWTTRIPAISQATSNLPSNKSEDLTSGSDTSSTETQPTTTTPPPTTQQQSTSYRSSTPQLMPLPPTYAPGSPGARADSMVNPYSAMPVAPTAYGLWDSQTPDMSTMMPRGYGMGMGSGMGESSGQAMQQGVGSGMGLGYGVPPAPTPTSSLGQSIMTDPSFGRFEVQTVREATAPREPATIGRSQSQILKGSKPFSAYKPARAYSPYLRLQSASPVGSNNYYEWVKPQLEQEQENRRLTHNVQGLSETARMGHQSIQSMKQRPGNVIQNAAPRTPATFMNTGQYYPGLSGQR